MDEWGISDTGHAGSSPQAVAGILRGSRASAVLSSVMLRAASTARKYACQPMRRLHVPEKPATTLVTQQIEIVSKQLSDAEPTPREYFPRDYGEAG